GIPFATPPLGKLRFHPPLPVPEDESRVVDASDYGPSCMQPLNVKDLTPGEISEDCLTLNIVRPVIDPESDEPLPVMVWIYGGGWENGASKWYDGQQLVAQSQLIDTPVIFVSMNYRVNVFGFLGSGDIAERAKSKKDTGLNLGYLDQRLALEWIQKHISYFGGDPKQVTVFGQSAGAIAVGAHLAAEKFVPRNLFRAAIMESG
ncbi:Carboxylesterase, partial [Clavulina sp. PMI_390]